MPASKQAWPNSALCWSPPMPPMVRAPPRCSGAALPNSCADGFTSGSRDAGMPSSASSSSSQRFSRTLNSIVREALLTSVTCTSPLVSFQISQLSIVPKASSPRSACSRAPLTWSRIHCSFVPEK